MALCASSGVLCVLLMNRDAESHREKNGEPQRNLINRINCFLSSTYINIAMKRVAFKMKLKPGCKQEYIKRHNEVWPEIADLIKRSGVSDYSIWLDEETDILFASQKLSGNVSSQELGADEIQQKWWSYMSDIMETNPDKSPVTIPLEEVFYLA